MINIVRFILLLLPIAVLADVKTPAVNTSTCNKISQPTKPFLLVLKKGEDISYAIIHCAQQANIPSASFTALGALKDPTVGYFDVKKADYRFKQFKGVFELISLNGNLATLDGKPITHIHVGLGNEHYQAIAGHLKNATVGVVAEITVIPFSQPLKREKQPNSKLTMIMTE